MDLHHGTWRGSPKGQNLCQPLPTTCSITAEGSAQQPPRLLLRAPCPCRALAEVARHTLSRDKGKAAR